MTVHFFSALPTQVGLKILSPKTPEELAVIRCLNRKDRVIADLALFLQHTDEAIQYQSSLLRQWSNQPKEQLSKYFPDTASFFHQYLLSSMAQSTSSFVHRLHGLMVLITMKKSRAPLPQGSVETLLKK